MKYIDYNLLYGKLNDGVEINMPFDLELNNCTITGNDIFEFEKEELNSEIFVDIQREYGITFFSEAYKPEINIYCVPYLQLFALDKNGIFGLKFEFFGNGDFFNSKIYYLTNERKVFYVSKNITDFIEQLNKKEFSKENLILVDDIKLFSSYFDAVEQSEQSGD